MKSRKKVTSRAVSSLIAFEHKRDAYGFAIRPQHIQRYKEYEVIYKQEDIERSQRWRDFLKRRMESSKMPINKLSSVFSAASVSTEVNGDTLRSVVENDGDLRNLDSSSGILQANVLKKDIPALNMKFTRSAWWPDLKPTSHVIDGLLSSCDDNAGSRMKVRRESTSEAIMHADNSNPSNVLLEEDSDDEFYDAEKSDTVHDGSLMNNGNVVASALSASETGFETVFPWKEELEVLVRGGVPMGLRGELWQAFVGVKSRWVEHHYNNLLDSEAILRCHAVDLDSDLEETSATSRVDINKWKGQIEKDLPRTFPGHPALDNNGRNALRRLLLAYARHNPSVGYCQVMNFVAALLLFLMPEENAFWTLIGIIDEYFDGYYSENMLESQVDQLVFEELVREIFPKLINHLDHLGVQVAWVTGPWFLSIFMNVLPWESVLRVWDVLLFEGSRVMLFKTSLALFEFYGPALVTAKDAGDVITLFQSLVASTFDSSQLVFTACMGYQNINESKLKELGNKHRPSVVAAIEERARGLQILRNAQGLSSKLYNLSQEPIAIAVKESTEGNDAIASDVESTCADDIVVSLKGDVTTDQLPNSQDQVVWLKVALCRLLEEKRSALLRAEELEVALMEMVKQDNRRQLSARIEQLELEVSELEKTLADKREQETAMLQVLVRVEHEQRVTEDARRYAEQDAAAQRYAAKVLEEKYEQAIAALAEMEKRVVMAESVLEATIQYQSGQPDALNSPRLSSSNSHTACNEDQNFGGPLQRISLLGRPFSFTWRDKGKQGNDTGAVGELQGVANHLDTRGEA